MESVNQEKKKTQCLSFLKTIKSFISFQEFVEILEKESKRGSSLWLQCHTCKKFGTIGPSICNRNNNMIAIECHYCGKNICKGINVFRKFYY